MYFQTDRLVIRRFLACDAADLFAYLHAPTVSCFFSMALSDMDAAHAEARKRSEDASRYAVVLRETGMLIGDMFAEPEDDVFAVGWHFNAAYGGQGYAYEAAAGLFAYLFAEQGARRLYAYVEDYNRQSQRLCEKLGMRKEGVFEDFISFANDAQGVPIYENTMQYALLRREWTARQAQLAAGQ